MLKKVLVGVFALGLWGLSVGCDDALTSALPDDVSKLINAAKGMQNGDVLMDQVQQRDRLRDQLQDGTGDNCPKAGTAARRLGDQDQLRLRDGTGVNCPN